jgi:Flp pilus assembly protein TadD
MLSTEAMLLDGLALLQDGRTDHAEAQFRQALRLGGEHPRALYLLGLLCLRTDRPQMAAALFRRALIADPSHEGAALNLARAEIGARRFAPALQAADTALQRQPGEPELHYLRGTALAALGAAQLAAVALSHALALEPRHAPSWLNLGNILADQDRLGDAERHIRRALDHDPTLPEAWGSLGFVLASLGRLAEAQDCCETAIRLRPDFAEAHWNLATAALLAGDFATGFREYEWRKDHDRFRRDFLGLPGAVWTGQKLAGRTVLIHAEQGLGDTIQLCRYAQTLSARGARIIWACDPALLRLLASAPGVDAAVQRGKQLPEYDFWVDQMSLPGLLGTTPATIPSPQGWLRADPDTAAQMRRHLPPGRRIGLTWAGNPLHSNDRRRSLPASFLPDLVAAGDAAGATWISLQTGTRAREAANHGLFNAAPLLTDFADTAAVLANLDLLVSVDTSIAHLAGAMGVPTLLLLPYAPDWRWILGRDDTPWYASLRLIRQERPGDWAGVIARLGPALSR